jgi:hypothetical protein
VPDYDKYFDVFAKEFGEKNKCKVEADYVATPDLPTAITARRDSQDACPQRGRLLLSRHLRGEGLPELVVGGAKPCSHPGAMLSGSRVASVSWSVAGKLDKTALL